MPNEAEAAVTGKPFTPLATTEVPQPIEASLQQLAALLKTHSVTDEEYAKILATLGRTPSLTELGIYSVMWSEHCSYKSSRVHLKRLPTQGDRTSGPGAVVQGPGENAGIIDVGDGWACAFKIESHNHPSYIEPYQGAATGVGGILRDIFTMGARPVAVMDSLRFGPLSPAGSKAGAPKLSDTSSSTEAGAPSFAASSQRVGSGEPQDSLAAQPHPSAGKAGERMGHTGSSLATAVTADKSFRGATEDTSEEADAASPAAKSDAIDYAKNRSVMEGVVHGVAGYGNCFGVPNLGGETRFEACYSGNPLLNAFALGLVRHDEIFYAKATGVGNPVIYVGAKTGRDGIHGATMASEEFTEGSEQKRPNVQMGDPFLEKLLLEACLEAMQTGAVAGIQDMGAAGLTCSTCEMGARGGVGLEIELDLVPQRDSGMSSYEIMLSESQERMLLVAHAGREQEVLDVFEKWGLDASVVGTVIPENRMRVRHHGVLVADLSNESLTDDAPVYHRPVGTWTAPIAKDAPAGVLDAMQQKRDYTADLKTLLASLNICGKRHVFEQYDSMVQTNTVFGPGQAEAGVIRIKGTGSRTTESSAPSFAASSQRVGSGEPQDFAAAQPHPFAGEAGERTGHTRGEHKAERGIAMALAGNGRWTYRDPKLGAMHAVVEAARKVACTGAVPVSATNCLNFGNPQKPEIMAQLSNAIDGIAEACTALGTPITGGNVSLYNETKGEGIFPTPVLGIVGVMDDVTKAIPSGFQRAGDAVLLVFPKEPADAPRDPFTIPPRMGMTEYARVIFGAEWGDLRKLNLTDEAASNRFLADAANRSLLHSAADIGSGGLPVALAKCSCAKGIGVQIVFPGEPPAAALANSFLEDGNLLVTCSQEALAKVEALATEHGLMSYPLGKTGGDRIDVRTPSGHFLDASVAELRAVSDEALERELEVEAVPA